MIPLNVLSVTRLSGTSVRVLFDGDPQIVPGLADGNFLVGGEGFQFVGPAEGEPDAADLGYDFQSVEVGDPWELTAQPAWAGAAVSAPAAGVVEE